MISFKKYICKIVENANTRPSIGTTSVVKREETSISVALNGEETTFDGQSANDVFTLEFATIDFGLIINSRFFITQKAFVRWQHHHLFKSLII